MDKGYKLGLYEKAMPNAYSLEDKVKIARDCGFDFMEISIDETQEKISRLDMGKKELRELFRRTADCGIAIESMCLSAHRKYPLGIAETQVKSLEIMQKAIDFASEMGIRIIQIAGYDVYYGESTEKTRALFEINLEKCVKMAAKSGVIIAFETMETDFMNTVRKAMFYVNALSNPYLKVYPDVGNVTNSGVDVEKDLLSGNGHTVAMHMKETKEGVFRDMIFGQGKVDFRLAARCALKMGVRRFLAEMWDDKTPLWKENILSANGFLRGVIDEVFIGDR